MGIVRVAAALITALVFGAAEVAAQSRSGFPAVFGGGADASPGDHVDLMMNLTQAYDDNLLAAAGAGTPSPVQTGGSYTNLAPAVRLQLHGRRLQLGVNGASTFRYYSIGPTTATTYDVGAGFSAQVAQKTTVRVNQAVSYAPTDLYALFGTTSTPTTTPALGEPIGTAPDYQANALGSYTYGTNASVDHALGARTSVSFNGGVRYTDVAGALPGLSKTRTWDAGVHLARSLSHGVRLRFGYAYNDARYSATFWTVEQDVDIGIDYTRPLSATRRLTLGFSLGPTVASVPPAVAGEPQGSGNHFRLSGAAFLERQIGRSWSARAAFNRGTTYVGGLAGPAYTDSASIETSGFVNRRVDLLFSAAASAGQMTSQAALAAPFTTYTADVRLRVALSRACALYLEGLFYEYSFDPSLVVVPGMPDHLKRNSVRVGIDLWHSARSWNRAAR